MEETRLKSRVPAFHKVNSITIREGVVDCVKGGRRGAHVRPLWRGFLYCFFSTILLPNMNPISATARGWSLFTPVDPNTSPGVMLLA